MILLAVGAAGCKSSPASSSGSSGSTGSAQPIWLCQPGAAGDPCAASLTATQVLANGTQSAISWPSSSLAGSFDCFYVYPTVRSASGGNSPLTVSSAEKGAAASQAAPFSNDCNVWAPLYRSQTVAAVSGGLGGDTSLLQSTFTIAFNSVLADWNSFLAQDDNGKPIVLIGDSQGAAVMIHLISTQIDNNPTVLHRLVVAILVGGNLQVPTGRDVGATFMHVPLCNSGTETGCAIAFSSFPSQPPTDSVFGRPGQGVSLQSGQTTTQGEEVACVNPAALGGGTGNLQPYFITSSQAGLKSAPATPWVSYPNLYSASCTSSGGATWLQVNSLAGSSQTRPVVTEVLGPTWGYHADEVGLTLGNLVQDVAGEEAAYQAGG